MKTLPNIKRRARVISGALTVGAGAFVLAVAPPHLHAAETKNQTLRDTMQEWQDKMSNKFRDTWRNLRKEGRPSVVSASVDLREQEKSYMLRLDLPGRDLEKVEITKQGESMHIVVPAADNQGRYEQTVSLAGADPTAAPVIERKTNDGVIVVTVAKATNESLPAPLTNRPPFPLLAPSEWESDVLRQMDDLRREMDKIFEDAFNIVPRSPELLKYFDQPRFGSFIDLKDEGQNYAVTAYLPERDVKNVNATVEGRILKIEALAEDSPPKEAEASEALGTRRAYYSQQLTLPGDAQGDKMTIERKAGILKATIPKAGI
jgi:HSP20 family molecular chaperone IbpA